MSKNICIKFYPDWLSLRWVFKICCMQSMESQIYSEWTLATCQWTLATCVNTCYLPLDKRGRLPFNGHHIFNEESSRRKMASVHCNSDSPPVLTCARAILLFFLYLFLNLCLPPSPCNIRWWYAITKFWWSEIRKNTINQLTN